MELTSNSNSDYCLRLKNLARITTKLLRELDKDLKKDQKNHQNIGIVVKKGMNSNLKQISQLNEHLDAVEE